MFKLVFIDLDNTLLNRSGAITPRSRAAISALVSRGIRVVLASGRPPRMVRRFQTATSESGTSWLEILSAGTSKVVAANEVGLYSVSISLRRCLLAMAKTTRHY